MKAFWTFVWVFLAVGLLLFILDAPDLKHSAPDTDQMAGTEHHKINERVRVGYWSYMIANWHWADFLGPYPSLERPDAKFLILDMVIENDDRSASTLPLIKVVDAQGREYDETSKDSLSEDSFGILKSLNPGVASRGRVAFDVPVGKYAVMVSGGLQSSETAIIELGAPFAQ